MNGAFLLASLLHVGGGGNHGKAAETGIGALVQALVATVTERTTTPLAIISWQNSFAEIANYICRRALQALQDGTIRLHNAELRIVHQDEIVNGIECIGPLALGTKKLFYNLHGLSGHANLDAARGPKHIH